MLDRTPSRLSFRRKAGSSPTRSTINKKGEKSFWSVTQSTLLLYSHRLILLVRQIGARGKNLPPEASFDKAIHSRRILRQKLNTSRSSSSCFIKSEIFCQLEVRLAHNSFRSSFAR